MATFGPYQFGAVADSVLGDASWVNPGNAITDNDGYATVAVDGFEGPFISDPLDYSSAGITEPGDADSVTSLTFEFAVKRFGSSAQIDTLQLIVGGALVGSPHTINQAIGTTEAYVGATVSLTSFATTLTGAQAKATGFGVEVIFRGNGASVATISVDAARVSGVYTPSGGGGGGTGAARHHYVQQGTM